MVVVPVWVLHYTPTNSTTSMLFFHTGSYTSFSAKCVRFTCVAGVAFDPTFNGCITANSAPGCCVVVVRISVALWVPTSESFVHLRLPLSIFQSNDGPLTVWIENNMTVTPTRGAACIRPVRCQFG